jgi:hypothetical protein
VFFKGLLGGNGTRTGVAFLAAAPQVIATDKVVTAAMLLYMPFAFEAERLLLRLCWPDDYSSRHQQDMNACHSISIFRPTVASCNVASKHACPYRKPNPISGQP